MTNQFLGPNLTPLWTMGFNKLELNINVEVAFVLHFFSSETSAVNSYLAVIQGCRKTETVEFYFYLYSVMRGKTLYFKP